MLWILVVGIILGGLAGMISRSDSLGGIWGDLGMAVIGSFIGGFLFNITDVFVYGTIESILSSIIGAIIFLWAIRMFRESEPPVHKKE
ncbi:GlsB/YeaQ/YmgE family stress response membrane protein [Pelosinus sp. IPA-1]|uniref:GlsB/YeaQ/YmgE family stress response membrane protein n=1 Tax=Pelosinus sp. IPA-1 TaxID=3029569 RepID=UPI0024361D34|nr:GlsB/YeaQ/YmgE family stress response membrane protein [Pelosinus sp. IPA-1]GMB00479.1 transglycosylase [Pelosinus sp. IPA-1]